MPFFTFSSGIFITNDFDSQLKATTQHLSYILIPFSLIGFNISKANLETIKKIFIWSVLTFIVLAFSYAFFDYLNTGKSTIYVRDSVQSKFQYYGLTRVFKDWHPTYVSFFCNLAFLFVHRIYFLKRKYVITTVISLVLGISVLALNSFIGIISFGFLASFYVISLFKKALIKGTVIGIILAIAFSFYHFNPLNLSKIDKFKKTSISFADTKESRNILNLRLTKWKSSYDLFLTAPILGVSAGDYRKEIVNIYNKEGYEYAAEQRYSSHNQYMYFLSSFGLIGLVLFLLVLFYPMRYKGEVSLFIFVFSLFCLTEDMLLRQQGVVAFSFFYCLLQPRKHENREI